MDTLKKWKTYKINNVLATLKIKNYRIIGNPEMTFSRPSTLWEGTTGSIAFCSIKKTKEPITTINSSKASVVLVQKDIDFRKLYYKNKTIVLIESPRQVFIKILNMCFPPEKKKRGIHHTSEVDSEAEIHSSVYIGPHCIIGKCKIQARSIIYPNVIINDNVRIGKQVIINPGCVIGYDGFGYSRNEDGSIEKFPHYGGVIIEDEVELGSNVSIDRGTMSDTIIKKGAKIDNFCHIAHNVIIGRYALVIANTMVGGSTEIGDYAWIAPSVSLREGIKIGEKAFVGLGAVVTKDIPDNTVVVGNPAMPLDQFKRIQNFLKTLPIKKE